MFGIGPGELMLLLFVALLVLGPERMPKMARDVGRVIGDLRRTSDELKNEFLKADLPSLLDPVVVSPPPAPVLESAPTETPAVPQVPPAPPETVFDRELREARERLALRRDPPTPAT